MKDCRTLLYKSHLV
jgi:hypothetical protein